jgi:hypothetical protein
MTLRPATAAALTAVVVTMLTLVAYGVGLLEMSVITLVLVVVLGPVVVPVALLVGRARRRGDLP